MTLDPHPYAEAWPMLGAEEATELAADIEVNGLRDLITLYQGKILDGRNRYAACITAEVEPRFTEFDGDDDDALAFVQSVNNARRHQSKGSLAASWALSMLAAGKRDGGRWSYGESRNSDISRDNRAILGVIADYAPDLFTAIRDNELSLNAAHQEAEGRRDAERKKLEREERLATEEADAQEFIESSAPDLARMVGIGNGYPYQSYAEAKAVWEKRNREEAERMRRERAEQEAAERAARETAESEVQTSARALLALTGAQFPEWRQRHIEAHRKYPSAVEPAAGAMWTAANVRAIAEHLTTLADELEH